LWILENVSLLSEVEGGPILEGTIVDINEQKRALEALRASEAKYRVLIENLEQMHLLKDRELRFVAANKNFCACLGHTEAEIVGKSDYDFYPSELADKLSGRRPASPGPGPRHSYPGAKPAARQAADGAGHQDAREGWKRPGRGRPRHFLDVSEQAVLEEQLRRRKKWMPSASSRGASRTISQLLTSSSAISPSCLGKNHSHPSWSRKC